MRGTQEKFHIETSLSEQQVEELLKDNLRERMLTLRYSGREGFAGWLKPETKEFRFSFSYRKAKCAVVTGYYAAEGERGTTVHFDIRWPTYEVLSLILGSVGCIVVPYIFTAHVFALSSVYLIGWPLVVVAFCAGSIAYYFVPGVKQARTRLLDLFGSNVQSVMED